MNTNDSLIATIKSPLKLNAEEIAAWRAFQEASPFAEDPFLALEFIQMVAASRPAVNVCILRENGRIHGYFPFQFRTPLHRMLRIAEPAGEYMAGHFGLIGSPSLSISPDKLLKLCGLAYMTVSNLYDTQESFGLTGDHSKSGVVLDFSKVAPGAYWSDLKQRNKDFVADTDRRIRLVQKELGPMRFTFSAGDWEPLLEQVIEEKRKQYLRTKGRDGLSESWKTDLLKRIAASRAPGCSGVLSTLYAGDTWLASHFGLRTRNALAVYFPVYNAELGRYSPGRVLMKALIDAAPSEGIELIDFGTGENQYKKQFGNDQHRVYRGAWYRWGIRSTAYRMFCSVKWRLSAI